MIAVHRELRLDALDAVILHIRLRVSALVRRARRIEHADVDLRIGRWIAQEHHCALVGIGIRGSRLQIDLAQTVIADDRIEVGNVREDAVDLPIDNDRRGHVAAAIGKIRHPFGLAKLDVRAQNRHGIPLYLLQI